MLYFIVELYEKHYYSLLVKLLRGKANLEFNGFQTAKEHAEHCAQNMTQRIVYKRP
ncbi:hypothetical protein F5Y16DRAFT_380120 [Xylariaceae sp. FL0255]|nr:hypothetical protein F5Y16DRAFT_380120 [Xylariaceae sp. FL0255]